MNTGDLQPGQEVELTVRINGTVKCVYDKSVEVVTDTGFRRAFDKIDIQAVKESYHEGTVVQDGLGILFLRLSGGYWARFNSTNIKESALRPPVLVVSTPESRVAARSAKSASATVRTLDEAF
jgi:hypothetical protein